jgi:hypothetical protein
MRFSSMAGSRSTPGRVMRMNQSGKRSDASPGLVASWAARSRMERTSASRLRLWRAARCRRRSLVASDNLRTTMLAKVPISEDGCASDITAIAVVRQANHPGSGGSRIRLNRSSYNVRPGRAMVAEACRRTRVGDQAGAQQRSAPVRARPHRPAKPCPRRLRGSARPKMRNGASTTAPPIRAWCRMRLRE